jgi:hypothetical protein
MLPEKNILRKDLFWLTAPEVLVHGGLVPFLLGCGEAKHHGVEGIVDHSCPTNGRQEAESMTGRGQGHDNLQRHACQ